MSSRYIFLIVGILGVLVVIAIAVFARYRRFQRLKNRPQAPPLYFPNSAGGLPPADPQNPVMNYEGPNAMAGGLPGVPPSYNPNNPYLNAGSANNYSPPSTIGAQSVPPPYSVFGPSVQQASFAPTNEAHWAPATQPTIVVVDDLHK
eukprot:Filipodium_phascolosomae@DN3755_c0_g1_i1.p1